MFFNSFDILSPNITLYYKDKKRHLSPLGGLFTLIIFFFIIYIILKFTLLKANPNKTSLIIYRNFEIDESNNYFNESGLFHFIWIYNGENKNNNEMQLNDLKKGIIRIYMTYAYDKYEYNSSNLKDNDHWVYDTCHNYVNEEDLKYDYSFSSCIKYYYNSLDKKYYSIHDKENFKWPYKKENITESKNKDFFSTFIEKCSNNSILNDILGECFPEEKIEKYLSHFNNILISFINNKIQMNNEENIIKTYSHKIYDTIINNGKYVYIHELKFLLFNYEEQKSIMSTKIKSNSFMLDEERTSKICINENNKLLLVYTFHFKKYINEFRKQDISFLEVIHSIGGTIAIIYYLFYFINYFLNERIEVRNFQKFLIDTGDNIIYRHINYEKNTTYSLKSNNNMTNISNDGNEKISIFKSTFGNLPKNDISNKYISNNNSKINEININKEKKNFDEKDNLKKANNIIVINNGTFMKDTTLNNNKKSNSNLNNISFEKIQSLKEVKKLNEFNIIEGYNKSYTYKKGKIQNQEKDLPSFGNNNNSNSNANNFSFYSRNQNNDLKNSEKNENIEVGSKQKVLDTSSIPLLNVINNKIKNLNMNNSNNSIVPRKEIPSINIDKNSEILSPKNRTHKKLRYRPREKFSQKDFKYYKNLYEENLKQSLSRINYKNSLAKEKCNNTGAQSPIDYMKRRRKSHQTINRLRKTDDNDSDKHDKHKYNKNKVKRKTGVFQIPEEKGNERHLSLFSKNSNIKNYGVENRGYHLFSYDNNSQINISKNLFEHYKRIEPLHKFISKKYDKEMASQESESRSKNQKKDLMSILKYENSINKFSKMIQNNNWSMSIFWKYLCLCRGKHINGVNILNKFRHKLLSEEYLYILHLNMFIFKQKFGCKSSLDKNNLLEELYKDL